MAKEFRMFCAALMLAGVSALAQTNPPALQVRAEKLDRGIVGLPTSARSAFISWRLLADDAATVTFNVYRATDGGAAEKLNATPLSGATCFTDSTVNVHQRNQYSVRPVVEGRELTASEFFTLGTDPEKPYLSIPLDTPPGYAPNDCSVADLDGDGRYEIIVHQAGRGHDNSHDGITDPPILQAYTLDGRKLWQINLGPNIREGAHYTQFMVYDLDGDGRAEIVCKTADGTVDGAGRVIGDPNANYVNSKSGRILNGPEFLTVFDGRDGRALATTKYVPARHPTKLDPTPDELKAVWGDGYGNRSDRFLAAVAYLDGKRPSVVMCRGYYTRTVLAAWDWRDGKLSQRWVFDSNTPGNENFGGQGNHNLTVADVNNDGRDEIIYGGMVVDADGHGLYSTGIGHGDAMHVSDLDPTRPGLEVFRIQERFDDAGSHLMDAATGQILWKRASVQHDAKKDQGPGRGLAADIDPRYPGDECWSYGAGISGIYSAQGKLISTVTPPSCNFAIWWDGDELRELLDKTSITKWNWQTEKVATLLDADKYECISNNGTKSTPALSGDILGDWREEVIWPTKDGKELRIFTTTIPTQRRLVTLMQDRQYRLSIAWQNVAYNQPPHPGFFIGAGMADMPRSPFGTQVLKSSTSEQITRK